MTTHESIYEYYLHQQQNCRNFLEECRIHAQPEMVHQLRLSIKKIRAFNKLVKHLGMKGSTDFLPFTFGIKKMFRLAGQIRDTQVQIHLLAAHHEQYENEYPEFLKWLVHREKRKISRLNRVTDLRLHHDQDKNSLHQHESVIPNTKAMTLLAEAEKVLNGLYTKAQQLSMGNISDENLHRIRKTTKQMRYIQNVLICSFPEFKYGKISIAALREIESATGNWHDNLVRKEMLDTFFASTQDQGKSFRLKYDQFSRFCSEELKSAYDFSCQVAKAKLLE